MSGDGLCNDLTDRLQCKWTGTGVSVVDLSLNFMSCLGCVDDLEGFGVVPSQVVWNLD